jgi:hypothetical protein
MNRIPQKLRNMGCKVKKKQCFTDYVSYLSTQYFVIFLEYVSCPVKPLLSSNSAPSQGLDILFFFLFPNWRTDLQKHLDFVKDLKGESRE